MMIYNTECIQNANFGIYYVSILYLSCICMFVHRFCSKLKDFMNIVVMHLLSSQLDKIKDTTSNYYIGRVINLLQYFNFFKTAHISLMDIVLLLTHCTI